MSIAGADVEMSSVYGNSFDGSKVVDGIRAPIGIPESTSIAITKGEVSPWMQIDLSRDSCASAVKIWQRYLAHHGNL